MFVVGANETRQSLYYLFGSSPPLLLLMIMLFTQPERCVCAIVAESKCVSFQRVRRHLFYCPRQKVRPFIPNGSFSRKATRFNSLSFNFLTCSIVRVHGTNFAIIVVVVAIIHLPLSDGEWGRKKTLCPNILIGEMTLDLDSNCVRVYKYTVRTGI